MSAGTEPAGARPVGAQPAPVALEAPAIGVPKGGGAIRGIGEKFAANPLTGTGSLTVPLATSPGRSGFGPGLSLTYDSGAGNGPFGLGWMLTLPAVERKTDTGLPLYRDAEESDVFVLFGAEDLVPVLRPDGSRRDDDDVDAAYVVRRYRPRIETSFSRIERWTRRADGDVHWRSYSRDDVLAVFGKDARSRVADPADPARVFRWLICELRDDKGNAVVFDYKAEDGAGVDLGRPHERNRGARDDPRRTANRYLKRARYGNRAPLLDADGARPSLLTDAQVEAADWLFEVVLDYGEHDADAPTPREDVEWPARQDPFSSYRAGFEVRTARLCRRVLMFHHFPDEPEVGADCLVRSTDLAYSAQLDPGSVRNPLYTLLVGITESGYRRVGDGYLKRSLPPLELEFSDTVVDGTVHDVDPESLENLPVGVDGSRSTWVDLHGDGVPGILTEQGDAWIYKRNLSPLGGGPPVQLGPAAVVADKPNVALAGGGARLIDLDGDGRTDVVVLGGPVAGVYEHDETDASWQPFTPFASPLNVDFADPNVHLVDFDGDGMADVLIGEDDVVVWHEALGRDGFGPPVVFPQAADEERGPRLLFSDETEALQLADLSGDGLADVVRIRNGECCYWPNLGRRFGAKVTMDAAPVFDRPDAFDPRRLRLADVDGTGTTDLVYLHPDGVRIYFNQSGNGWSAATELDALPPAVEGVDVSVVDLFGNGTACLVWSSALPADAGAAMRYVDLVGGEKPHLLVRTDDNLGAETRISYAPSTRFSLADERAGRPWLTRLPFPVHVVDRVESLDHVAGNRFVTTYGYHHGYFDGVEREFRGFGMVEQRDSEEIAALGPDPLAHLPPVVTRTWFHTGVFIRDHASDYYADEYFREPGLTDDEARALLLPDTLLPEGLTADEAREACRALKGSLLRQEVYAADAGPGATGDELRRAATPYTVAEQDFRIRVLQRRGPNRHAAFFVHALDAISFHYERNGADPRVQHTLTLEVDDYGNVLKELGVGYGRRETVRTAGGDALPNPGLAGLTGDERAFQTTTLATYGESRVTNAVDTARAYRTPAPCETATYELTGFVPTGPAGRFAPGDVVEPDPDAAGRLRLRPCDVVPFEEAPTANPCRRGLRLYRTLYRSDDLATLLPLGGLESLGLPGESYKLAFTPGLLAQVYERPHGADPPESLLPDPASVLGGQGADRGGYLRTQELQADGRFPATDPDDAWWIPTGRAAFTADPGDGAAAELAGARAHFFVPRRYRDPFGQDALVTPDPYDLLLLETRDALDNRVTVEVNDYRVLQPRVVSDPNRNRTAVAFDALGLVVGSALMGKPAPAPAEGDSLDGFAEDLTDEQIDDFVSSPDPAASAAGLLAAAGSRVVYDVDRFRRTRAAAPDDPARWQPPCVATIARETHSSDPPPAGGLKLQVGFTYSDGLGREVQKKIQAEPGPVAEGGAAVEPRWVGTGWTVFDDKGNPVRKYEPFFTATHAFEPGALAGVSPVLFYDPVGRLVATLNPAGTFEKAVFDPWRQTTYDANDTCAPRNAQTGDPRTDPDVGGYVAPYLATLPHFETWFAARAGGALGPDEQAAAERAAAHADTPTTTHLDVLGRPFLTVARNRVVCPGHDLDGTEESLSTVVVRDVLGSDLAVRDALRAPDDPLGRIVVAYAYDLLGNRIRQVGLDAGARWTLPDVAGKPIRAWDSRGHVFTTTYDVLRRAVEQIARGTTADSDPRLLDRDVVVGRNEYGEGVPDPEALNLRTHSYRMLDGAGVTTDARLDGDGNPVEAYDFKGNLLCTTRQLTADYTAIPDWSGEPELAAETFETRTRFDALNRLVQSVAPRSSLIRDGQAAAVAVVQHAYNEANLLERVDVWLDRAEAPDTLLDPQVDAPSPVGVAGVDYDAKGRRLAIDYANGGRTTYRYDPDTFKLTDLGTTRAASFGDSAAGLQSLHYTYDAAGNITHLHDAAQQTLFFRNKLVEPSRDYVYDALYRLIQATGREHLGQNGTGLVSGAGGLFAPGDGNAMGTYLERYVYDGVGNVLQLQHHGTDPANAGWTRAYAYEETSLIEDGSGGRPLRVGNRLSSTTLDPGGAAPQPEPYAHDPHGNVADMPHLGGGQPGPNLHWDYRDQLCRADLGGGGTAYYVYDSTGKRTRKVWEKAPGLVEERVYLGVFELFRRHGGPVGPDTARLERTTLHVTCGDQRVALVETRTLDVAGDDPADALLIRYQIADHLGSSSLELDDQARIVSYEEYAPYGSSTYQAVRSATETPKRYRFTGRERDEETGLAYHGARYYASWLAVWTATDPLGVKGGLNGYAYCENHPVAYVDPLGLDEWCGLTDGFFGLFDGDCHIEPHISGGIKTVGGALETAGGATMVVVGGATCEVGVGCFVAAAGVAVTAHGVDTTQSGFRSMIHGEQVDSFTSLGLQKLGVSRRNANLADAGISIVGSFGASAATRTPGAVTALTEAGADTTPSISLALKPALGPGHNYVGVTTADGVTTWSHLVVDGATRSSGVVTGGTSFVETIDAADMAGRLGRSVTVTVPVTASQAEAALTTVNQALSTTAAGGEAGFGAYSLTANSCSTYAASVMNSAGISTPALTSPLVNLGAAALHSPTVAASVTANTVVGATVLKSPNSTSTPLRSPAPFTSLGTGIPNPADFDTFESFRNAVQGVPYTDQYLQQQWDAAHSFVGSGH